MKYNCLQDVIEDIYTTYELTDLQDLDWDNDEFVEGLVTFGDKSSLLELLAESFEMWDEVGQTIDLRTEYTDEPATWCFYCCFKALPYLKDPSVIPEMLKYLPYEPDRAYMYNSIEYDMLVPMMVEAITNTEQFGLEYIPWLLQSLDCIPGSEYQEGFALQLLGDAIFDTFDSVKPDQFPERLPAVDVLSFCNRSFILKILNILIEENNESIERSKTRKGNNVFYFKEDTSYLKEGLACLEYVRGQLLLMMDQKE